MLETELQKMLFAVVVLPIMLLEMVILPPLDSFSIPLKDKALRFAISHVMEPILLLSIKIAPLLFFNIIPCTSALSW